MKGSELFKKIDFDVSLNAGWRENGKLRTDADSQITVENVI